VRLVSSCKAAHQLLRPSVLIKFIPILPVLPLDGPLLLLLGGGWGDSGGLGVRDFGGGGGAGFSATVSTTGRKGEGETVYLNAKQNLASNIC